MERELDGYGRWMYGVLLLLAFGSNISTAMTSIAIGLGALVMLAQWARTRQCPRIDGGLAKAILLYLAVMCVSASQSWETGRSFQAVLAASCRVLPMFFAMAYVKNTRQLKWIFLAFACSVLLDALCSMEQSVARQDPRWNYRPTGFNNSPTFLAAHMLMAVPVLFFAAQKDGFSKPWRRFLFLVFALSVFVLGLSETRGAWLSFVLLVLIFMASERAYWKKTLQFSAIVAVLFLCAAALFPSFQSRAATVLDLVGYHSSSERRLMWQSSIAMWKDYPLWGVGPDEFAYYYNAQYISPEAKERADTDDPRSGHSQPHNNLLMHLTECGLMGLAAFLLLHGYVLYRLWRLYREERKASASFGLSYAFMGILVFFGLHLTGMTDTNVVKISIMREYWMLMGIAMVAGNIERREYAHGKRKN